MSTYVNNILINITQIYNQYIILINFYLLRDFLIFLYHPGWLGTCYITHANFTFLTAVLLQVWGLQVCSITPSSTFDVFSDSGNNILLISFRQIEKVIKITQKVSTRILNYNMSPLANGNKLLDHGGSSSGERKQENEWCFSEWPVEPEKFTPTVGDLHRDSWLIWEEQQEWSRRCAGPRSPVSSWGIEEVPHLEIHEGSWDVPNAVKKPLGEESKLN